MKIFPPAFFSAVGRSRSKQPLTSYVRSGESKKVSTKSAGEVSRLIVFSCFAITERDTPSCHYSISRMKTRGLGRLGAYTCRLPLRTRPPELFRQFDCLAPVILQNQNSLRVQIVPNVYPGLHLPKIRDAKTITSPSLALTYA